jgi:hypothetical protein
MRIKRGGGELVNRLGNILARRLNGNVVVLLEVDARVLLRWVIGSTEELALNTRVGGSRNMLSFAPLSVARASSVATAFVASTASTTRVPATTTTAIPTSTTIIRKVGRRGAVSRACPIALTSSVILTRDDISIYRY